MPPQPAARIIVVMGVSSSGKSTVGEALAKKLGIPFLDADAYHPAASVEKMRAGIALADEDRWPWLARYAAALSEAAAASGAVAGACSALRRSYRDFLAVRAGMPVVFVYLEGERDLIAARIARRQHHYMPASLLDSQFAALEVPGPEENAITVRIDRPVADIVDHIARALPPTGGRVRVPPTSA